jgi:hypothetical protein
MQSSHFLLLWDLPILRKSIAGYLRINENIWLNILPDLVKYNFKNSK